MTTVASESVMRYNEDQLARYKKLKGTPVKVADETILDMWSVLKVATLSHVKGYSLEQTIRVKLHPLKGEDVTAMVVANADILASYHDRCLAKYGPTGINSIVDPELRKRLFDKFKGKCAYCGNDLVMYSEGDEKQMEFEHIVPKALGGTDDESNLNPTCVCCNREKGVLNLEAYRWVKTLSKHFDVPVTDAFAKAFVFKEYDKALDIKPIHFHYEKVEMINTAIEKLVRNNNPAVRSLIGIIKEDYSL